MKNGWWQQVGKVRAASVPYFFAVGRWKPTSDVDKAVDAQNLEEHESCFHVLPYESLMSALLWTHEQN